VTDRQTDRLNATILFVQHRNARTLQLYSAFVDCTFIQSNNNQ